MLNNEGFKSPKGSLRHRILASVGAMVLLSVLSSAFSLYRISEVNRLLEAINHVSIPLGRLLTQMQSDVEVFHRELERNLGQSRWKDPHWKPKPIPEWVVGVLTNEMGRVSDLVESELEWANADTRIQWHNWAAQISRDLEKLVTQASRLASALEKKGEAGGSEVEAAELYARCGTGVEAWKKQLQWGSAEYERSLRQSFSMTENRVVELQTGLEVILGVVVILSLLVLWLGERALRPLSELTRLAREITRRGLRKQDKSLLPEIPISRSDEVSQLAREFHHMATALLEREKTVETQKDRLQQQNQLLRDMGELNQNILNSIDSVLIVTDLSGRITQCNPEAIRWLGGNEKEIMGSDLKSWTQLQYLLEGSPGGEHWLERLEETAETWRLGPFSLNQRVYGGQLMPLRQEKQTPHGAIIVLDDLTEEVDLQERLRRAENLAAVGRMSAQVAHEVRNPLHSIGLEAEMAIEFATRLGEQGLRQSLQSILNSVDRLQKITENYLKLSRLSAGQKKVVDLGQILELVLATYAPVCEVQGVLVDWHRGNEGSMDVLADPDLFEQVLGNLFRNSLQALEGWKEKTGKTPCIRWTLRRNDQGQALLRIQDNGPGISGDVRDRLFTPFVTTRAQGTGLGLSFAKKVLEEHGGSIRNIENPEGIGAGFELQLAALIKKAMPPDQDRSVLSDRAVPDPNIAGHLEEPLKDRLGDPFGDPGIQIQL